MALTPRLDMRQGQSLVMTPQLQQAIKLLQMSNMDLTTYVEEELAENPLLERAADGDTIQTDQSQDGDVEAAEAQVVSDAAAELSEIGGPEPEALESLQINDDIDPSSIEGTQMDVDYDNTFNNDSPGDQAMATSGPDLSESAFSSSSGGGGGGFDDISPDLEQTLSGEISLRDHLSEQIGVELSDPADRLIGTHLIDMLDESGYVSGELEQVADMLGCPLERVEATLERMQQFDPPGILALNLAQCLAIQLKERDRLDPAMQALLDNLDVLAKHDLSALTRICGVDEEDITDMVGEIRSLDPKPALAFDHMVAQPVSPDVLMRAQPGGGWVVELNNETLPRVLVNNQYYAEISRGVQNKEDKQYVSECFQSANWLVKSLHQRATTILKVASEIVRQQDAFFIKGVQHLRPLVLRDIADIIDMHESTVSRVTSNKYMATPRGIFELKYFFTTAIASMTGGDAHSAESVRQRIKELINAEPVEKILSDDKIVDILQAEGIDIARRTVAKYREAMGIPSSVQRRREKRSKI